MRGVHCDDIDATSNNILLNSGSVDSKDGPIAGFDSFDQLKGRCQKAEADYAFMFLTFLMSAILVGLGLLTNGRRGGNKAIV